MDDAERSVQILRMQSIYSSAKSVVVALESGVTADADVILKALDLFQADPPHLSAQGELTEDLAYTVQSSSFSTAIRGLCNDIYWTRIWIIQEIAIGNNVKLLIHDKLIRQSRIWTLLSWLKLRFGDVMGKKNISMLTSIRKIRDSYQNNTEADNRGMLNLLEMTKDSSCGRIEDRVFGLMGLMLDALKYLPEPDYERDLTDTTIAICRAYIEKQSLDILCLAPHCHPHSNLPTWCPDFFRFDCHHPDRRIIRHLTEQTRDPEFFSEVSYRGNTLLTRASLIGTIRSLGSTCADGVSSDYPKHDPAWTRQLNFSSLAKELVLAAETAGHTEGKLNIFATSGRGFAVFGHGYIQLFDPRYGSESSDHANPADVKWVCNNRSFFTGALTLGEHAANLKHPVFRHGVYAWHPCLWKESYFEKIWSLFADPFRAGMRLMCVESAQRACIGWVSPKAQLQDQIVHIPGCSKPVVLRRGLRGSYQVVGDAIVPQLSEWLAELDLQEIRIQ